MQRNEFPVRLDEKAIREISNKSESNDVFVRSQQVLSHHHEPDKEKTLRTLLAFHEYLVERRVEPGFQVVIGE